MDNNNDVNNNDDNNNSMITSTTATTTTTTTSTTTTTLVQHLCQNKGMNQIDQKILEQHLYWSKISCGIFKQPMVALKMAGMKDLR